MNPKLEDKIVTYVLYFFVIFAVLLLAFIIFYIIGSGFRAISLDFLISSPKAFQAGGGIGPQIINSFLILFLTLILTVPLGIGAGIYLAEYTRENVVTNVIRLSIETLSSLPSIIIGLFGLLVFVTTFGWGFSMISGAMALTVLNLPVMTRVTEEALRDVKRDLREASFALGATKWQTITRVVLVAAVPRLITGIILASGRIFGEAAALIFTAGMTSPKISFSNAFNIFRPAETLAVHIWKVNSEGISPDVRRIADGSSAVLILIVIVFNFLARFITKRLYKRLTGA
ncbi:MAG: phosphate ABC transporter permease PstA [Thermovenabulum sp.]|uniref:phosphate ABC transporter permease PstA n=1 Tax=Thermovenabulum sp. TaxID=3100335 RepID=UPI003C7A0F5F